MLIDRLGIDVTLKEWMSIDIDKQKW
jgi:hypothetical protein